MSMIYLYFILFNQDVYDLRLCLLQIVKKTFVREAQASNAPNQVAGEILSFFTRNNFEVLDRGETIT